MRDSFTRRCNNNNLNFTPSKKKKKSKLYFHSNLYPVDSSSLTIDNDISYPLDLNFSNAEDYSFSKCNEVQR